MNREKILMRILSVLMAFFAAFIGSVFLEYVPNVEALISDGNIASKLWVLWTGDPSPATLGQKDFELVRRTTVSLACFTLFCAAMSAICLAWSFIPENPEKKFSEA